MRGPTETSPDLPDLHALDADDSGDLLDLSAARPIPMGKRAYGMIRISKLGKRKRTGETNLSKPEQQRIILDCANANGIEIIGWRYEMDVSGGRVDRKVLEATLADVFAGKADGIICAYVSRYARTTDGIQAVRKLNAEGKMFIAVQEGIGPASLSTPAGWLMFTIMVALAEFQLRILTEGFLSARRAHVEAGIANQTPYGYRKRPKTAKVNPRRLEADPLTSRWVPFIFERRAAGASWPSIAKALDEAGAPVPGGGKRWLWTRARHIVTNRTYLGELHSGEYVNRKAHEPLVSAELFDAANKRNVTSARNGSAGHMLTGIIRCATCGGRMVGFSQTVNGKRDRSGPPVTRRYYRCRRRYSWGICPKPATIPAGELEDHVVATFFERFSGELNAFMTDAPDRAAEVAAADARIAELNAAYDRWERSPQTNRMADRRGQAWYDAEAERRNDEIEQAEAERQEIVDAMTGLQLPPGLKRDWPSLGVDVQRGFLSDAFGVVAVKPFSGRRVPVIDRVHIWARDETGSPEAKLPRRGATIDDKITAMVPIKF